MAKKKKGKQKAHADLSDARDEMIAIEAIYGSAYQAAENGRGFKLRVTPGAVDANQVSVTLEFGCPLHLASSLALPTGNYIGRKSLIPQLEIVIWLHGNCLQAAFTSVDPNSHPHAVQLSCWPSQCGPKPAGHRGTWSVSQAKSSPFEDVASDSC